jgi:hypothetical protein
MVDSTRLVTSRLISKELAIERVVTAAVCSRARAHGLIVRFPPSEPRQIHFDAQPLLVDIGSSQQQDKAAAMSKYFSDYGHHWSFLVYNDGDHFHATSHKILIDPSKVGVEQRVLKP